MNRLIALTLFILFTSTAAFSQTGGIGAVLMLDTASDGSTMPRIKSIVPNSPAAAQNLPEGSFIIEAEGTKCRDKSLESVVSVIRGNVGTVVTLKLADNAKGKKAKTYEVKRAEIVVANAPKPPADPIEYFSAYCAEEIKKLRRKAKTIIKSSGSDCGDYFFSFDATNELYHVQLFVLELKGPGTYIKGFEMNASVYDNSNETDKKPLLFAGKEDISDFSIATYSSQITPGTNTVGVVTTKIKPLANPAACRSMYVVVYK